MFAFVGHPVHVLQPRKSKFMMSFLERNINMNLGCKPEREASCGLKPLGRRIFLSLFLHVQFKWKQCSCSLLSIGDETQIYFWFIDTLKFWLLEHLSSCEWVSEWVCVCVCPYVCSQSPHHWKLLFWFIPALLYDIVKTTTYFCNFIFFSNFSSGYCFYFIFLRYGYFSLAFAQGSDSHCGASYSYLGVVSVQVQEPLHILSWMVNLYICVYAYIHLHVCLHTHTLLIYLTN